MFACETPPGEQRHACTFQLNVTGPELQAPLIAGIHSDFVLGWLGFDFYVHFGSWLQLHFFAVAIDQFIGNSNLLVQVVCPLYRDLGFLGFPRVGVGLNHFFDSSRKCGSYLTFAFRQ